MCSGLLQFFSGESNKKIKLIVLEEHLESLPGVQPWQETVAIISYKKINTFASDYCLAAFLSAPTCTWRSLPKQWKPCFCFVFFFQKKYWKALLRDKRSQPKRVGCFPCVPGTDSSFCSCHWCGFAKTRSLTFYCLRFCLSQCWDWSKSIYIHKS